MDKASVSGAEDCGFESHLGWPHVLFAAGAKRTCPFTLPSFCVSHSSSLAVEHRSYEPGVAGSIPAWSIASACSVMVIIGASQALDPGSIPGRRSRRTFVFVAATEKKKKKKEEEEKEEEEEEGGDKKEKAKNGNGAGRRSGEMSGVRRRYKNKADHHRQL